WSVRATARLVPGVQETVARLVRVPGRQAERCHDQHVPGRCVRDLGGLGTALPSPASHGTRPGTALCALMAAAFRAQIPMLVIGGQGASTQVHMGSLAGARSRLYYEADHEICLDDPAYPAHS